MSVGTRPLTWGADSREPRSRGCTSKVSYGRTQARTVAASMARTTGTPAYTYKCLYARHWHVTTKPQEG